jgi:hypothetical protein
VILVVRDAGLEQLLTSAALVAQAWPGAWEEVMLFIQVLRMSVPSLAEALAVGLITVQLPPVESASARIALECGASVLTAVACGETGVPVEAPHLRPAQVWRLDITDLAVGGLSGLRLAG